MELRKILRAERKDAIPVGKGERDAARLTDGLHECRPLGSVEDQLEGTAADARAPAQRM